MSHLKDHELITTDLSLSDLTIYSRDRFILEEICVARSVNAIEAFSPCHIPCLRRFLTSFCHDVSFWFVFPFPWQAKVRLRRVFSSLCLSFAVMHRTAYWSRPENQLISGLFRRVSSSQCFFWVSLSFCLHGHLSERHLIPTYCKTAAIANCIKAAGVCAMPVLL